MSQTNGPARNAPRPKSLKPFRRLSMLAVLLGGLSVIGLIVYTIVGANQAWFNPFIAVGGVIFTLGMWAIYAASETKQRKMTTWRPQQ